MTTENQIAIAEACGWKVVNEGGEFPFALYRPDDGSLVQRWKTLEGAWSHGPFFNSLDSMQSAVLSQDEKFQYHFAINLNRRLQNRHAKLADKHGTLAVEAVHQLTVTDWQESFVETLKQLGRL